MFLHIQNAVATQLIRFRWLLLGGAAALAMLAWFCGSQLPLDRSVVTMFAPDDPLRKDYERLRKTFHGNDMLMCVYDDPGLLHDDLSGMERAEELATRLETVHGVRGVLTLGRPLGAEIVTDKTSQYSDLRNLLEGFTHGSDGHTACAAVILDEKSNTTEERMATLDEIASIVDNLPEGLSGGVVAGEPVMLDQAFRLIEADGRRLVWLTTTLLGLTILFCFRSIRWVIIPVLVVQFALLLTRGFLAMVGIKMTLVSSMLTAVVTVVGIATVIHVIVRFREGRQQGLAPEKALAWAGSRISGPIFWACLTDAIGFLALTVADVVPIREFGFMMAVGALMVFVSVVLLVPGLALLGNADNSPSQMWGESVLGTQLRNLVHLAKTHASWVLGSLVVLVVFSVLGIARMEIETDFTRNFRSDSSLVQAYEVVESRLGGAGVCDIVLPAPDRLDRAYLTKILKLERALRREVVITDANGQTTPGFTKVISIADILNATVGDLRRRRFLGRQIVSGALGVMRKRIPAFYNVMYSDDPDQPGQYYYRIMLRAKERQPAEQKVVIIDQVRNVCREHFPDDETRVTGYFVLLTNLIRGVLRDQWRTFAVALVGIWLTMLLALRSLRLALIALIPNALPILIVNGTMGWLGVRANMGAAMIAAVSVGLSIDSTIHYLFAWRAARSEGYSATEALEKVHDSVGRSLVFSTFALIIGFFGLAFSQFIPTVYFGVLVSFAMFGGLLGNLIWLPALIQLTEPQTPSPDPVPVSVSAATG